MEYNDKEFAFSQDGTTVTFQSVDGRDYLMDIRNIHYLRVERENQKAIVCIKKDGSNIELKRREK